MLLNNKNKKLIYVLLTNFFSLILSNQLDPTFGTGGVVVTSIGISDFINSATCQSDNKIVVAGFSTAFSDISKLVIARYTTNGTLDTSYNSTGIVKILIGSRTEANAIAMQTDNKAVVSGFSYENQTNLAVMRLTTTGGLDSTFNGGGYATMSIGSGGSANSVKILPDGKIIAAGTAVNGSPQFVLTSWTSTGTLDTSFGTSGKVFTQIGSHSGIKQIALQPDGKIVAAGYAVDGSVIKIALARYNTDGSLDSSFGSTGIVTTEVGVESIAQSVAIDNNGNIVVAGFSKISDAVNQFVTIRYNSNGSLDTTFNTIGIVTTQIQNSDAANSVAIQSDGKIIAAGSSLGDDAQQFALVRYLTDGTLDATFGANGIELTTIGGTSSESSINSIFIQADSKIVAAGFSNLGFALARYLS